MGILHQMATEAARVIPPDNAPAMILGCLFALAVWFLWQTFDED